jgi:hypothetical protein
MYNTCNEENQYMWGFASVSKFLLLNWIFSAAYKHADGKKIDGRRVLVDVERARTVKGWLPRRLGTIVG